MVQSLFETDDAKTGLFPNRDSFHGHESKVKYIHGKIFWAVISRIQITVVVKRMVWHENCKVIAKTS